MKLKSFLICSLAALLFGACEDTLTDIGSSVRPDTDNLIIKRSPFNITSSTFLSDPIYVRTPNPLLGQLSDPLYGTVRADYAAEFRIEPGLDLNVYENDSLVFEFRDEQGNIVNLPEGDKLDSMVLSISYLSYIGDSISPMAVTAYELNQPLPSDPEAFYSDFDFTPFVSDNVLGSAGYTGIDFDLSDSIRDDDNYIPYVDITLNQEVTDRFYNAFKNDPSVFEDQESFEDFFAGVYFKNTFGNGTILKVTATSIGIFYKTEQTTKSSQGADSTYIAQRIKVISVTPDVVQLNNAQNPIIPGGDPTLLNAEDTTYITTPGGYFTSIKLPIGNIIDTLNTYASTAQNVYINGAGLSMKAFDPTGIFGEAPPTYMLLIQKDSINDFFENNKLPNSESSFLAALPSDSTNTNYGYNFGNLNKLVEKYRNESEAGATLDTLDFVMVPVTATLDQNNNITRLTNYFVPGGIKLKRDSSINQLELVYTIQTE